MATRTDKFEYWTAKALASVLAGLPLRLASTLGEALGLFAFDVLRLRRSVTLENLARAFPTMPSDRRLALARRTYRNFGITLVEFVRLPRLSTEELRQRVRFPNRDLFERAQQGGRGGILVAGHLGNWEWMAAGAQAMGYNVVPIVAYQRNPLVDRLIDDFRRSAGVHVVKIGPTSVRETLRVLKRNDFVGILFDQDAGRNAEFVRFFGSPASTARGPAIFHLKTGAPIIFACPRRIAPGRHLVHLEWVVDTGPATRDIDDAAVHRITQTLSDHLEQAIRAQPDQWFWMHRRWKTPPPEDGPAEFEHAA